MNQRIKRFLLFLLTIFVQFALSMLAVFTLYTIFGRIGTQTPVGRAFILAGIWTGYIVGICAGGWFMRFRRRQPLWIGTSLWLTAAASAVPLLILFGMSLGYQEILPPADFAQFQAKWQPVMAQFSFLTGMLGFHLPGWLR